MPTRTTNPDNVAVEELFNYGRMREGPIPLWHKVLFLLYIPVGVVLLLVRSVLFLMMVVCVLTLPHSIGFYVNPLLLRLSTGTICYHNHKGKKLADVPHIIACNHVSDWDTFPMYSTIYYYWCIASAHLKNVPLVGAMYTANGVIFVAPSADSKEQTRNAIVEKLEENKRPILIFPEGGLTNGKKGTMMYHKFVFGLDYGVVPCAIKCHDNWPVEMDYLGSSFGKNLFWLMFLPYHVFEMTFLPIQFRREEETAEDFAFRVQSMTSHHLGIVPTKHSYTLKKELLKKIREKSRPQRVEEVKEKAN